MNILEWALRGKDMTDYFVKLLMFYGDIPNSVMDDYLEKFRRFEKDCRERRHF